jgi:hypothetical protein
MFIQNKYFKWYHLIIDAARIRKSTNGYTELHHILPRCAGGNDDINNIIQLTAREHFICHLLLPKFTSGEIQKKMHHAAFMLTVTSKNQTRYKVNNRRYEVLRTAYAKSLTGRKLAPRSREWSNNISKAKKGVSLSELHKNKLSEIKKGKPWSEARKKSGRPVTTPYGIFNSISEAERQLNMGKNTISYRIKTKPTEYYISSK